MAAAMPTYLLVLCIVIPLVICGLVFFLIYICCSKKYRLNWFERTLLDSHLEEGASEKRRIKTGSGCHGSIGDQRMSNILYAPLASESGSVSSVPSSADGKAKEEAVWVPPANVTKSRSSISGSVCSTGSATAPDRLHIKPRLTMTPSVDTGIAGDRTDGLFVSPSVLKSRPSITTSISSGGSEDQFWVPPNIAQKSRSRANSMAPTIPSEEELSDDKLLAACSQRQRTRSLAPTIFGSSFDSHTDEKRAARARAHSMVPTILCQQSSEEMDERTLESLAEPPGRSVSTEDSSYLRIGSSPSRTPTQSSSLQEMRFEFPAEKFAESGLPVHIPNAAQRNRRRASMQDALDHTKINASLYERAQSFHQSFGSLQEENLGSVNFSLNFNEELGTLTVRLLVAQDLQPHDRSSGIANPYCKLCLLPNRRHQLQSRVQKKTSNPEFEEDFVFEVPSCDIKDATLEILVYDFDAFSHDECIGQIKLPLEEVDLSYKQVMWKGLSPFDAKKEELELGDLMFSLSYLPSAERLTVVVQRCRNIRPPEEGKTTANPLVKVSLIHGGKRIKKKKTSTKRNTLSPSWNEALVFGLPKDILKTTMIELVIFNDNLLGNNEALGKVTIGPESSDTELSHWKEMISGNKSATARWHSLVPACKESSN